MDIPARTIAVITAELGALHMSRVAGEVTPDTLLDRDLAMNSLDVVCVGVALEEAFGIELGDAAIEGWRSVGDVIASVRALVGEGVS